MTVLVTRPSPDNARTADTLRARGFDVLLAPMLRFEPVAPPAALDPDIAAVIVTSANAVRAIQPRLEGSALRGLPLFAVGAQTASAAEAAGFANVISADGDSAALRALIRKTAKARGIAADATLLYLAAADVARDLSAELADDGFHIVMQTVYRMAPMTTFPRDVCDAFAAHGIRAVLHYSRRSAQAFVAAARGDGVEISALSVPQCCLSKAVAEVLREAGASQVTVAKTPDESALMEGLGRALRA